CSVRAQIGDQAICAEDLELPTRVAEQQIITLCPGCHSQSVARIKATGHGVSTARDRLFERGNHSLREPTIQIRSPDNFESVQCILCWRGIFPWLQRIESCFFG